MQKKFLTIAAITLFACASMTFISCEDESEKQEQVVEQMKSVSNIPNGMYSYKTDKGTFVVSFRNGELINIKGHGRLLYKSSSDVEFDYRLFADTKEGAAEADAFVERLKLSGVPCICQGTAYVGENSYIMICYSSNEPCWFDEKK